MNDALTALARALPDSVLRDVLSAVYTAHNPHRDDFFATGEAIDHLLAEDRRRDEHPEMRPFRQPEVAL